MLYACLSVSVCLCGTYWPPLTGSTQIPVFSTSRGWIAKSGLKFGVEFLAYRKGPLFFHSRHVSLHSRICVAPARGRLLVRSTSSATSLSALFRSHAVYCSFSVLVQTVDAHTLVAAPADGQVRSVPVHLSACREGVRVCPMRVLTIRFLIGPRAATPVDQHHEHVARQQSGTCRNRSK